MTGLESSLEKGAKGLTSSIFSNLFVVKIRKEKRPDGPFNAWGLKG